MNYIDKLKAVKKAKDISIRTLSQSCELTERGISNILKEKCSPTVSSLEQLCEVLDIDIAELFNKKEKKTIKDGGTESLILETVAPLSAEAQKHLLWIADKLKGH